MAPPSDITPPTPEDERWAQPPQSIRLPPERRVKRARSTEKTLYTVPRRFDIATMLTVSFAYSLLFTLLRSLDAQWPVFAFIGGMTVVVAIAQALFPYGNDPRWASAVAGVVYSLLWWMGLGIIHGVRDSEFFCAAFAAVLFGPLMGYLCGACEAGVFLVADQVRRRWFPEAEDAGIEEAPLEQIDN